MKKYILIIAFAALILIQPISALSKTTQYSFKSGDYIYTSRNNVGSNDKKEINTYLKNLSLKYNINIYIVQARQPKHQTLNSYTENLVKSWPALHSHAILIIGDVPAHKKMIYVSPDFAEFMNKDRQELLLDRISTPLKYEDYNNVARAGVNYIVSKYNQQNGTNIPELSINMIDKIGQRQGFYAITVLLFFLIGGCLITLGFDEYLRYKKHLPVFTVTYEEAAADTVFLLQGKNVTSEEQRDKIIKKYQRGRTVKNICLHIFFWLFLLIEITATILDDITVLFYLLPCFVPLVYSIIRYPEVYLVDTKKYRSANRFGEKSESSDS